MTISYKDSWDKIQESYQAGDYGSHTHLKAEAAFKIKSSIDSANATKRLIKATWVLAIFTICLFISTLAYTIISYRSYKGIKDQIHALNTLTEALIELPKTEFKLNTNKEVNR